MTQVKRLALIGAWIPIVVVVSLFTNRGAHEPGVASPIGVQLTFSRPLDFDHPYFPFETGAMNVYRGTVDDLEMTIVERYLPDVRLFQWAGQEIACAIVEETEFQAGELSQISYNFYAQADDGSVWFFGEFAEEFNDGELSSRSGSWLVGGLSSDDPPDTAVGPDPALHLPALMSAGEVWTQENIPEHGIFEQRTVLVADRVIRVPAGEYANCVKILEESHDDEIEAKWYAPGVGVIEVDSPTEKLKLVATAIRRR